MTVAAFHRAFLRLREPRVWMAVLPFLIYNLIALSYVHAIPIWDAREYADALFRAVRSSHLQDFAFYGHPSLSYGLLVSVPQFFSPDNFVLLNVTSFVLGNLSVVAFLSILRSLFPSATTEERMLAALAFACHPVLFSNTLAFNLDSGVAFFTLYLIAFLLRGRMLWAILTGCVLVLTKETGLALFMLVVGTFVLLRAARSGPGIRSKFRTILRHLHLFLPCLLFAAYVLVRTILWDTGMFWGGNNMGSVFSTLLSDRDFFNRAFIVSLADIFVLNFLWVETAVLLLAIACGVARLVSRRASSNARVDWTGLALIVSVFLLALFLLTRMIPYNNVRYFAVIYTLMPILVFGGARAVFPEGWERNAVLTLVWVLHIVALGSSNDPVSSSFFGTFAFGQHRMYTMSAAIPDPCCGYGRDQLVYNLQYTRLPELRDDIVRWAKPTGENVIATESGLAFFADGEMPIMHGAAKSADQLLSKDAPDSVWLIRYPNFREGNILEKLTQFYRVTAEFSFNKDGYRIPVIRLQKLPQ